MFWSNPLLKGMQMGLRKNCVFVEMQQCYLTTTILLGTGTYEIKIKIEKE